jgi:preprotein translocase subunit YajC
VDQGLQSLILLGFLIAIFYFMLIRPQKRRVQEHQRLIESVEVGDEVVTIGGLYGKVVAVGDDQFELEAAPGTVLRFAKSAIARRLVEELADDEEAEEEAGA